MMAEKNQKTSPHVADEVKTGLNQVEMRECIGNAMTTVVIGLIVSSGSHFRISIAHRDPGIGCLQEGNVVIPVTECVGSGY